MWRGGQEQGSGPRPPPCILVLGGEGAEAAAPFKLLTVVGLALLDYVHKVVGEDEGDSLPIDPKLGLKIPQKVAEIHMEKLMGGEGRDQSGIRERAAVDTPGSPWGGGQPGGSRAPGAVCLPVGLGDPGGKAPSVSPPAVPTCPLSRIMMLSLCRSPMPSTYVATQ